MSKKKLKKIYYYSFEINVKVHPLTACDLKQKYVLLKHSILVCVFL